MTKHLIAVGGLALLAFVLGCQQDPANSSDPSGPGSKSGNGTTERTTAKAPAIDIWKAAGEGNIQAVKQHIAAGTDINATFVLEGVPGSGGSPLHIAVAANQSEIAELLIRAGANLNVKAADDHGGTPLHWAAALGQWGMAKQLIAAGADVNATDNDGFTPLDATNSPLAADKSAQQRIAKLLEQKGGKSGADGRATRPQAPSVDIFTAVLTDDLEAVKQHIAAGTNLNVGEPQGGSTPLNLASVFGKTEAARALIDAGANLEIKNNEGATALYNAAFFCHPDIVKALLEKGADVRTTGREGLTPLQVAESKWSPTLEGIYRPLLDALGIQRDLKEIKKLRPVVAKLLRDRAEKVAPHGPALTPPQPPAR
jgi:uncharacterized protein